MNETNIVNEYLIGIPRWPFDDVPDSIKGYENTHAPTGPISIDYDVNTSTNPYTWTCTSNEFGEPFYKAYATQNVPKLKELFAKHNEECKRWYAHALAHCVNEGKTTIVQVLLEQCINTGIPIESNLLPVATFHGYYRMVKHLLDYGADLNYDKSVALRIACYYGYENIVELFLDRGVNLKDNGRDALLLAEEGKHSKIVKLLLDRGAKYN